MFSTLNKTKFGNCITCGAKDTEVVKVKKDTYCTQCHQKNKALEQIEKQKRKNAIRLDGSKVRKLGKVVQDLDFAERNALIADIDREFSFYIRLRDADKYGYTHCFTSGKRLHYLKLDCGHYISRMHMATRWDADNCRPQSKQDNQMLHGNIEVFKEKLEAEQKGITDILYERSKEVTKPTMNDLKQLLIHWREKAKFVKSKLI